MMKQDKVAYATKEGNDRPPPNVMCKVSPKPHTLRRNMHTADYGKTYFHFNSDFSGDIVITQRYGISGEREMKVDGRSLINFVIEYAIKPRLMGWFETLPIWDKINELR